MTLTLSVYHARPPSSPKCMTSSLNLGAHPIRLASAPLLQPLSLPLTALKRKGSHIWDYPKGDTGQFFPPITCYPTHGKRLAQHGDCRILRRCSVSPSLQLCRCPPERLSGMSPHPQGARLALRLVRQGDGLHYSVGQPLFGDSLPFLLTSVEDKELLRASDASGAVLRYVSRPGSQDNVRVDRPEHKALFAYQKHLEVPDPFDGSERGQERCLSRQEFQLDWVQRLKGVPLKSSQDDREVPRGHKGWPGGIHPPGTLQEPHDEIMLSQGPAVHCIVVGRDSGHIHFQGGGWQPTLQPFLQERKHYSNRASSGVFSTRRTPVRVRRFALLKEL